MTDLRKAAEMALEFIVLSSKDRAWFTEKEFEVVAALRQALAQPEQEPVAWQDPQYKTLIEPHKAHPDWIPLYTAPPKREWVGLTMQEYVEIENNVAAHYAPNNVPRSVRVFAQVLWETIEAKLKEKNSVL